MSLSIISDIIHQRRSVYPPMYTGEKVKDELINQLLANANQAPSHKQTEPWRFHVITGDKLQSLADFFQRTYKDRTPSEEFQKKKYQKLGKNPLQASHVIAIGMKRHSEAGLPEWEEVAAVSCAIQNLFLSVTAAGLGGYWSSPELIINHISEFISMEEEERCLGFFYIGVPKAEIKLSVQKGDIKRKTKWYR